MSHQITWSNIKSYIEANKNMLLNKIGNLPKYQREQITYRMFKCRHDCAKQKQCINCGCKFPDKLYAFKSCNPERFPDIMTAGEWERFKIKNNIHDEFE